MIPGEIMTDGPDHPINPGRRSLTLVVRNTADRPIQVGSHYHFAETNPGLSFDRAAAHGTRLDIPAGTAVRFEPGQTREVKARLARLHGDSEGLALGNVSVGVDAGHQVEGVGARRDVESG